VWALDRGSANLEVLDHFPGRTPYQVVLGPRIDEGDPETALDTTTGLERLVRIQGEAVALGVELLGGGEDAPVLLDVERPGRRDRFSLVPSSSGRRLSLRLGPDVTELTGSSGTVQRHPEPGFEAASTAGDLTLTLAEAGPEDAARRVLGQVRLSWRSERDEVAVLVPVAGATAPPGEPLLIVRSRSASQHEEFR
jgi:hypothetical protein